jgi:L,D-peptidoglycan transpeptidase YkuD (ErfK/YbiS/YcfS/YnhG family)
MNVLRLRSKPLQEARVSHHSSARELGLRIRLGAIACAAVALISCSTQRVERAPLSKALPWAEARQLVLVTTPDWNATQGTLRTFVRDGDRWHAAGAATPIVIGRAGAAWGLGLHPPQPGLQKREGDGRSPAGVFTVGTAFGYAASEPTALPYEALGVDEYCVDVASSPFYNRIVDAGKAGKAAVAGSTEPMRRDLHENGDEAYKIGFVIEHNPRGVAGAGSCIFAHLWKTPQTATAGCTAMTEAAMRELLGWLEADAHPVFVLLPQVEYRRLRAPWQLP